MRAGEWARYWSETGLILIQIRAHSNPQAALSADRGPLLIQPLRADGDLGAKLLGEEGDAKFFYHPAIIFQLGIVQMLLAMLLAAGEITLPMGLQLCKLLLVFG